MFVDEVRDVGAHLPDQIAGLQARAEPWLWNVFKVRVPHSLADVIRAYGDRLQAQVPTMLSAGAGALFGTLSYVAVTPLISIARSMTSRAISAELRDSVSTRVSARRLVVVAPLEPQTGPGSRRIRLTVR